MGLTRLMKLQVHHRELPPSISPEDFVCVWTTSSSVFEATTRIAKFAGRPVSSSSVMDLAKEYRRQGVELKPMT